MARRWDDQADENMLQNPLPPTQYGVTDEEKAKWNNKQDALEFDDEPTEFSSKMLNSSVVFTALKKVQNALTSAYKRYVDVVLGDLPNTSAFTKLVNSINTMDEKVNTMDEKVNTMDEKVNTMDEKVNNMDEKVGSIDEKVGSIDEKVTNYPDLSSKADKDNTVLTGSISLGRAENTRVAEHSVSLGLQNTASEVAAYAEGEYTQSLGRGSHAEGMQTIASVSAQHVQGKCNVADTAGKYAHIVGGGSSDTDRKNIHTVDWQGTAEYAGDVIAQGCDNAGAEPVSLLDVGIRLNNLEGTSRNSVFEEITVEHPDVTQNTHFVFTGGLYTSTNRAITIYEDSADATIKHYVYNTRVDAGDVLLFTNAYGDNFVSSMYANVVAVSSGDYHYGSIVQCAKFSEIHAKGGYFEVEHPGELFICVRDYDNHPTQLYMRRKKGNTPIVLWSTHAEQYLEDATVGDEVLNSVIAGKQVYVRVPNTDGNKYTAIYSPVYMYQLPNYANSYLYLFYLTDEKQDLTPLLGYPVKIPVYGELKLKLSKEYNQTPLW